MSDEQQTKTVPTKRPKERSPSFPFIPLKTAAERLEAFQKFFGRHLSPTSKAGLAWGMREKSSQADQTLAALRSFGLVQYKGSGTERQAELTEEGRTYIRTQQESVKKQILKQSALRPKVIRKYWASWGPDRPPDAVTLDQLYAAGFSDAGAANFLKVYDDTIAYAGLSGSDKIHLTDNGDEADDSPDGDENKAAIGDLVQWASGGALQFPTPRRVTGVSEDGTFVFVEGSNKGIPMSEVQLAEKPEVPAISEAPESQKRVPKKPGIIEATLPLEEGLAVLQLPDQLTDTSYQDLEDWLELMLRRAKRSVPTRPLHEEERTILGALGYSDDDINGLTFWRARDILSRNKKKSEPDEAPGN